MTVCLVTGAAGFIGFHLAKALLAQGHRVIGIDNLNDYYSTHLKRCRLQLLSDIPAFQFQELELADREAASQLFDQHTYDVVFHLAAQAGVRYSLENPYAYLESNVAAFLNVLEGCRNSQAEKQHLVYASSSSVYGANTKVPFSISDSVDHPVSLYAATKKSNELMAHAYSHLYGIPTTGLRFFTVYGPWGRPDMAIYRFTEAIVNDQPIDVYNHGKMRRDFTYIDDIVEGVIRVGHRAPRRGPEMVAPYQLFNIGNNQPVELERVISILEECLGKTAKRRYLPMQPGDVLQTYADIDDLQQAVGFRPSTSIEEGIRRFVDWYLEFHHREEGNSNGNVLP